MRWVIAPLKPGSGNRYKIRKPQETQLGLVEIEFYGIPVESRTLPAAYGWTLADDN